MNKIPLVALLAACCISLAGQTTKTTPLHQKIEQLPLSPLPIQSTDTLLWFEPCTLTKEQLPGISFHIYTDLNHTEKARFDNRQQGELYRRFKPQNQAYEIWLLEIGKELDSRRMLLLTWFPGRGIADTLEIEIYTSYAIDSIRDKRTLFKEFTLSSEQDIWISELRSLEPDKIRINITPNEYLAQRVDTHYHIEKDGQIKQLATRLYKPRKYPFLYIKQRKNRLLEGTETLQNQNK